MQETGRTHKKLHNITDETYIRPKEAAGKWKLAANLHQTVYLYGVTGIGKTALAENMLSRCKYDYFTAAHTNPEQIRIPKDGRHRIVVIDDLHTIMTEQAQEEFAPVLEELIERKDVWLILISRCRVPRWLLPLHVRYAFLLIEEKDLCLSRKEQDLYYEKWNLCLPRETADQLWEAVHGNPLLLRIVALDHGDLEQAGEDICSYLEAHVFDQWDLEIQEFIIELSVVGQFDIGMARMITGRNDVEQMIAKVCETGNFLIETDGIYRYRPILRQTLIKRLVRCYSQEHIRQLYYHAGHMYEMRGELSEAVKMYETCDDQEGITRILIASSRENPTTGQYFELRKYYFALPEKRIAENPVLMAGMSMLQSMLMNEEESERWYDALKEYAKGQPPAMKREIRSKLLYLDIALPHRGVVGLVDILKNAGILLKDRKAVLQEFSVTSNLPSLMNGGKDFCEWSKKDRELAASIGKVVEFVLGKYGKGLVSLALAESFFEKGEDSYETAALAQKGRMQAESGGKKELCFAAVGLLSWLSVFNGHFEDAAEILDDFEQSIKKELPRLLPNLQAMRCRLNLYRGRVVEAAQWMKEAPNENEEFYSMDRLRYLTKARVYLLEGKYQKAYGLLQKMSYYAEKQKRIFIRMEVLVLLAILQRRLGRETWKETLQTAISQAEEYHFVRLLSREGGALLELLEEEDFLWKDEAFKNQVFAECEQMAALYPAYLKRKVDEKIVLSGNALKILRLQAEGFSTEQIARSLKISQSTVKYHSKETYRKLGVSGKTAAVNEARNRKMI